MDWNPNVTVNLDPNQSFMTSDGLVPLTAKDIEGWVKITGQIGTPPFFKELMRATFWCPPHPPEVELNEDNIPYMQVYKQYQPEVWSRELLEMTMFDLMDEYLVTEPFKVMQAYIALSSGAHGHMEGVAIPALWRGGGDAAGGRQAGRRSREHARLLPPSSAARWRTGRSSAPAARWRRSSSRTAARSRAPRATPQGARRSGRTRR
jgi:hypothetical protein